MILHNGQDITADIRFCKYNLDTGKYDITFQSEKTYSYNCLSIVWLKSPKVLNPSLVRIKHGEQELFDIQAIYVFHGALTDYWRICFSNKSERSYDRQNLAVEFSCLSEKGSRDCMNYLRQLAEINELRSEDGIMLLQRQYERLDFVERDSALAVYLNPQSHKPASYQNNDFIFPFGGNASQFKAVQNALTNQISVIQGPPGTGKTQTILNIIANLLVQGKTVQVVSNNNSAIANIFEKLSFSKCGMAFLVASLGNANNKAEFIKNQTGKYPVLSEWEKSTEKQESLYGNIKKLIQDLTDVFARQERLATLRQELKSLELEIKYFRQYCTEACIAVDGITPRHSLTPGELMELWQECCEFTEKNCSVSFWFKVKSALIYGISNWNFYRNGLPTIIALLQNLFYKAKRSELNTEITFLVNTLKVANAEQKLDELEKASMEYVQARLFAKYGGHSDRIVFTSDDLWQQPNKFTKEYPVVLSTTFSSLSSLGKAAVYDYLIMDEASQVDIATGALALSCAKNAVIVGDLKQLPNVVKDDMKKQAEAIFKSYKFPDGYSFANNSCLKSICSILPDVPRVLLREHYRCHPKIIGFCNQKFYDDSLIIMTKDNDEPESLSVYKTLVGNHEREHFNQRQIDVICKEILPKLQSCSQSDIGIIAPYNAQVKAIKEQLNLDTIEVATVHKFQGREKDIIILTSVDDTVTEFSDNPYLLNVAVSRAKKRFYLVVSGNDQPADSNIGDLISYIEYNNFQIVQSEIYSVFDYLYQQYTMERMKFLEKYKQVSRYDSENLMYGTIVDILACYPALSLNVICHQSLNMLIRNPKYLSDEERKYAMNTATHVDFLIYNRISKKPVFAIEVDGFHYHKDGTRQKKRDRMKDHIFELYHIPLLRFPTIGSGEKEKIEQAVKHYEKTYR
ncbi:MAG: AAA domain-containing protein [Spirochaetia bacterium]|jgi:superfamily I DNA and/or RNA helicase|nr:AAA domain-containing protein [Spirochaetia bacterium]